MFVHGHGGSCAFYLMFMLVHAHVMSYPSWFLRMVYVHIHTFHDASIHVTFDQSGSCTLIVFISSSACGSEGACFVSMCLFVDLPGPCASEGAP